jgi:hypothetical protein
MYKIYSLSAIVLIYRPLVFVYLNIKRVLVPGASFSAILANIHYINSTYAWFLNLRLCRWYTSIIRSPLLATFIQKFMPLCPCIYIFLLT